MIDQNHNKYINSLPELSYIIFGIRFVRKCNRESSLFQCSTNLAKIVAKSIVKIVFRYDKESDKI